MTTTTAQGPQHYGLLAEFDHADDVVFATAKARRDGYSAVDAFSPFPVEALSEALLLPRSKLPILTFLGGLAGGVSGFLMQCYCAAIDYPIRIAGRPYVSWPAFVPVTFESTILGAVLVTVFAMIILNGLPRPHHPLFNVEKFEAASRDKFFLCIEASDPKFELTETRRYLESLRPTQVYEVPE